MRTSERAYHQIRWDRRLAAERFVIGVDVHRPEPKRVPLPDFQPGGDIPWHRVLFIELDGVRVWDRATGVDRIDALAAEGLARPRPLVGGKWRLRSPVRWNGGEWRPVQDEFPTPEDALRLVSWNVLWDRHESEHIDSARRWPRLLERVLVDNPHLVALQEVDPALHALILDHPTIREHYWVSHGPDHADIGRFDLLILGRVAVDQVAMWPLGPHKNILAAATPRGTLFTVHLTSDHSAKAARTREGQLSALREIIARTSGPLMLAGDFNAADESPLVPMDDAWMAVHDQPAPTFDPTTNPLAKLGSLSGRAVRIDRVYLRGLHTHEARRLGVDADEGVWMSDHMGLSVTVAIEPPADVHGGAPSVRSALAWVPDDDAAIQAVRADHDPSFGRWPAHVNVLWGFVDEFALDSAIGPLETAMRDARGFATQLDKTLTFTHKRTASHGLVPGNPGPWISLYTRLRRAFPRCGRAEWTPHLTFARTEPGGTPPEAPTVQGEVGRLVVLTRRGEEPFAVRATAWPGGAIERHPEAVWPAGSATPIAPFDALPGAIVVGSHQLGCAIAGSDLDLVWIDTPAAEVRALLEPHVDALLPVVKGGLEGFRGFKGDLVVDALPASGDPRALSAISDGQAILDAVGGRHAAFVALMRVVKGWARAQALDDAAWGGVEGLAWAVLAARTVLETDADPVQRFFAMWAAHDWSRPVALNDDVPAELADSFGILTPSGPVRNIAERVQLERFERALLDAWSLLDDGGATEDLLRPFAFHQRFPVAIHVRTESREAAGRARGRARALLDAVNGVPCPGQHAYIGLEREDDAAFEAAEAWAASLEGVEVVHIPTPFVPSPRGTMPS